MVELVSMSGGLDAGVNNFSSPGNAQMVSLDSKNSFQNMLQSESVSGFSQVSNVVQHFEGKFNSKHVDIVKNLKDFEGTGGAVALMMATHQGANNSIMVQLCGTVSKKCADNTEQIYKQQ